jgi:F0F1-type ATP synthase assembly protein I
MKGQNEDGENSGGGKQQEENKKSAIGSSLEALAIIPQVSLSIAIPIVLGAWAGHWIDQKLGTGIIFFLILLFAGIASGFYGAYNQIKMFSKRK